jgi:hypothetical protein
MHTGRDGTGQFRPTEPEPYGFWVRLNMLWLDGELV